jgi:hypothetical protein
LPVPDFSMNALRIGHKKNEHPIFGKTNPIRVEGATCVIGSLGFCGAAWVSGFGFCGKEPSSAALACAGAACVLGGFSFCTARCARVRELDAGSRAS